jgi:hypothetical protein
MTQDECAECVVPLTVYIPILYDPSILLDYSTFDGLTDTMIEYCQCLLKNKCVADDDDAFLTYVRAALTGMEFIKNQESLVLGIFDLIWTVDWQAVHTRCLSRLQVPSSSSSSAANSSEVIAAYNCIMFFISDDSFNDDQDPISTFASLDDLSTMPQDECEQCRVPLTQYMPILYNLSILLDNSVFDGLTNAWIAYFKCMQLNKCLLRDDSERLSAAGLTEWEYIKDQISLAHELFDIIRTIDWRAVQIRCLSGLQVYSSSFSSAEISRELKAVYRCVAQMLSVYHFEAVNDDEEAMMTRVFPGHFEL